MDRPTKRIRTTKGPDEAEAPASGPPPVILRISAPQPLTTAAEDSLLDVDAATLLGSLRQVTQGGGAEASAAPNAGAGVGANVGASAPSQVAPLHTQAAAPLAGQVDPSHLAETLQQQQQQQQQVTASKARARSPLPDSTAWNKDELIHECTARDNRCSRVIGRNRLCDVAGLFKNDAHVMADVVGDGAKIATCPKRGVHPHMHSHFYSVADARRSKRRLVPVFLFWKARLGWDFPITDEIVEMSRAHLSSCGYGFFPGNGHLKTRPKLCIHPGHLYPSNSMNYEALLKPLIKILQALELYDKDPTVLHELKQLGWNGSQFNSVKTDDPKVIFASLLQRVSIVWSKHKPDPPPITTEAKTGSVITPNGRPSFTSQRTDSGGRKSSGRGRKPRSGPKSPGAVANNAAEGVLFNNVALSETNPLGWTGAAAGGVDLTSMSPQQQQQQQMIMMQQQQQLVALQQQIFIQQVQLQRAQQVVSAVTDPARSVFGGASSMPAAQQAATMQMQAGVQMLPGQVLPGQVLPGQVLPGQMLPGQVLPGQVSQGQVSQVLPGQVLPGQVLPGQMLPGQMLPGQVSQGQVSQVLPGQVLPGQVLPGRVLPGQVLPGQVLPGQVLPGQVLPGHVLPGHVLPGLISIDNRGLSVGGAANNNPTAMIHPGMLASLQQQQQQQQWQTTVASAQQQNQPLQTLPVASVPVSLATATSFAPPSTVSYLRSSTPPIMLVSANQALAGAAPAPGTLHAGELQAMAPAGRDANHSVLVETVAGNSVHAAAAAVDRVASTPVEQQQQQQHAEHAITTGIVSAASGGDQQVQW